MSSGNKLQRHKKGPQSLREEGQGNTSVGRNWGGVGLCSGRASRECWVLLGLLMVEILEEVPGAQQNIHQLSRCVLSGSWSTLIGQHQGRGSLVNAAGPEVRHGMACPVLLLFRAWG